MFLAIGIAQIILAHNTFSLHFNLIFAINSSPDKRKSSQATATMSTDKPRPDISRDRRQNDSSTADSSNRNPNRSRRSRSRSQKRHAKSPIDHQSSIKRSKIADDATAKQRDRSYTPKKGHKNRSPISSNKGRKISPSSTQTKRDDRRRDSRSPAKKSGRYQRSSSPKKSNNRDSSSGADRRYPQQRRSPSSNVRKDKKYERQRSRSRSPNRTNRRSRTPKESESRKRANSPKSSNRRRSASQSRSQRKRSASNKPSQRERSRSHSRNRSPSKNQNGSSNRPKQSNSNNHADHRNQSGNSNRNHSPPIATAVAPTLSSSPNRNEPKAKDSDKSVTTIHSDTRTRRNSSRSRSRSRSHSPRQASRSYTSPKGRSPHRDRYQADKNDTKSSDNHRASRREDFLRSPKRKTPAVPLSQPLPTAAQKASTTKRRTHSSDSNASSLSYSPARKNPERYKDILDRKDSRKAAHPSSGSPSAANLLTSTTPNDKSRTPPEQRAAKSSRSQSRDHSKRKPTPQQPVVRLHTSTDSDDDNVDTSRLDKYEEIINTIRKDDEILKALSGIAAKAKEKIKTMSEPAAVAPAIGGAGNSVGSVGVLSKSPDAFLSREMAIASVSMASNTTAANILNDDIVGKGKSNDSSLKINEFKIKGRKDIADQCIQMAEQSTNNASTDRSRSKSTGADPKDVKKSKKHSSSRSRYGVGVQYTVMWCQCD